MDDVTGSDVRARGGSHCDCWLLVVYVEMLVAYDYITYVNILTKMKRRTWWYFHMKLRLCWSSCGLESSCGGNLWTNSFQQPAGMLKGSGYYRLIIF